MRPARQIVADLEEQGYLVKIEDYNHNVGSCYRCGTTIEPMIVQAVVRQDEAAG